MKNKLQLLALACAAIPLLGGCAFAGPSQTETEETVSETAADVQDGTASYVEKVSPSVEDYRLRDNKSIYEDDDESSVVTMYLTVREGNSAENTDHTWTEINTYSKYWYEDRGIPQYAVEGILQVGDENGPLPDEVGYDETVPNAIIKIRGQTSTQRTQKNYKIELKDGKGEWRNQRTINLNKHVGEGLRFRNKLAYDLMKEVPQMMAARTQFVHLYVKDETEGGSGVFEDYGLYTQVEQINGRYLKAHGLDNNGHLYKNEFFEFHRYEDAIKLITDPTYDLDAFETYLEVKGDTDHSKLIEMLEDVNDYSIPIEETVEKWFDTENLFYWMGFQILMGNEDTNARNYFIYSPLNVDKFYIISWDNDSSLTAFEDELVGNGGFAGSWEAGISNYWGSTLFQRMYKIREYRDGLTQAIETLRSEYLTEEKVSSLIEIYRNVVKPYVYSMPDIMHARLTEDQYDLIADNLAGEIEDNYQAYLESLEEPMPFYIGVPSLENGKLRIVWDPSYDFDNESITYQIEIASDYMFQNILYAQQNIRVPDIETDPLPEGQYFIRIYATNESGKTQSAFDYYVVDSTKIYGTKCFYVLADGTIAEDLYVEGE
ncbi:MAG TPA: CotH kinase family protein [Candidatus Eisenbergiella merdigallinarum]|uniref:CotH kinase family protein n=1 Tax=Candidatus Eisenbergiella merdigallinarum TaxID=2838552 RepID=A0A9D2MSM7_9FIRM|nr:CotH kinase family protein [Candidatus Eisenbergiella merdigallinarum]